MMDHNSINLAGWVTKTGVNEMKFGPVGWMILGLQHQKGIDYDIPAHVTFVGVDLGSQNPSTTVKNRELFAKAESGGFVTLWDCALDSYVKYGETKTNRRIKASISKLMITKEAGVPVNNCSFVGKVIQLPTSEWAELQCSHRPGPNADKGLPWPMRSIKVYLPGGKITVKVGHQYYIEGFLSNKSPSGNEDLIVVANLANGI